MQVPKEQVDVRMEIPGAVIRQRRDFGDASGYGKISAEYFTLSAGVDTTPLFKGLEGDLCQCPHWGYVLRGQITTTDARGERETVRANDLFYWPEGHNVKVDERCRNHHVQPTARAHPRHRSHDRDGKRLI